MRKNLKARQDAMRQRQGTEKVPCTPAHAWTPIDHAVPVESLSPVTPVIYQPKINGVYLLTEGGLYYVGQSADVPARIHSHRLYPVCCQFTDPRGVLLSEVPLQDGWTWAQNARTRLQAEARFIAAALSLGLALTNKLSDWKKGKLLATYPDLSGECNRISEALKILC